MVLSGLQDSTVCRPSLLPGALPHLTGLSNFAVTYQMHDACSAGHLCGPDLFESLSDLQQLQCLHLAWPPTPPPEPTYTEDSVTQGRSSLVSLTGFPVLQRLEEFRFDACLILDYAALRFVERQPALGLWNVRAIATTHNNVRRFHDAMPAHVSLEIAETMND